MTDSVITVENLSKRYVIGHQRDVRDALRHRIEDALRHPFQWARDQQRRRTGTAEEFWALKNVSLEIPRGAVVGIIGRNGAGKSTLLKILSQITEPTTGRIRIQGRVASLLEVGTGFHQELTGRENIFLNGAILGMTRRDVKRKFDDIVAFSEVGKFLDTPVKRYSSGMYVRLAFAVAAHLEPDILIVDEVLAVGDAAFQKKCLGKMGEVARGGRTVLFVSHNLSAVQALCNHAVYLKSGTVNLTGAVEPVLNHYLAETVTPDGPRPAASVQFGKTLKLVAFELTPNHLVSGEPLRFSIAFEATAATTVSELSLLIYSTQNVRLASLDCRACGLPKTFSAGRRWRVSGVIPSVPFVEGDYNLGLFLNTTGFLENVLDLATFTVRSRPAETGYAPYPVMYRGLVELDFTAKLQ